MRSWNGILVCVVVVVLASPLVAATSVNKLTEKVANCANDVCSIHLFNDVSSDSLWDCFGTQNDVTSCWVYQSCFARATAGADTLVRGEIDCLSAGETCSLVLGRELCTTDTVVYTGIGSYCLDFEMCYTDRDWDGIELLDGECRIFWAEATVSIPNKTNARATAVAPNIRVCVNNEGPFIA